MSAVAREGRGQGPGRRPGAGLGEGARVFPRSWAGRRGPALRWPVLGVLLRKGGNHTCSGSGTVVVVYSKAAGRVPNSF